MLERTRNLSKKVLENTRHKVANNVVVEKLKQAPGYFTETPFERVDPPLSFQQMVERETWMMEVANIREDGDNLSYSPSEGDHYDGWEFKWDGDTSEWNNARRGDPDKSRKQYRTREKHRDKNTGNMANKFRVSEANVGKSSYSWPESKFYNNPEQSSYTQPTLIGWAVKETYESFKRLGRNDEAQEFLEEAYGTVGPGNFTGLRGENAYFLNHRATSEDNPLIFNVHPNETGRDYDSALGFRGVDLIPGKGDIATFAKTGLRWARMQQFGHSMGKKGRDPEGKRPDWIPEQVRKKYAVNDVMFNVLFVRNLRDTADIASELARLKPDESTEYKRQAIEYRQHAGVIETAILSKMWHEKRDNKDKKETFFYNLNARKNDKQINVKSITGLFPLLLDDIKTEQLNVLLDRLEDPEWFATPYPIPSHPRNSKYYDPHYRRKEGPNWQGPVWLLADHLIVEQGLVRQGKRFLKPGTEYNPQLAKRCMEVAGPIVEKNEELLAINKDVWEFYDPETGQGKRVRHFMWSNLGLHFEDYYNLKEKIEELAA
jgi:hypothetical protein